MRWAVPTLAALVVGCGGGGGGSTPSPTPVATPSAASSPSATASPSPVTIATLPLAVVVKDFLVQGGTTYTLNLVGTDGRVAASVTAAKRSQPDGILVQMPNISASNTRVYYLDGDSKVMALRLDGTTGLATTISVDTHSAAVFAVSPDDTRIAVAVITFPYPARTRIYVEDLNGGGHHVDIFSSSSVVEWPVGWHQGHVVIGVGLNAHPQNAYEGYDYADQGYHVADAANGNRLATVCGGLSSFRAPVAAGVVCAKSPSDYEVSDWTGTTRTTSTSDTGCGGGALSPDGLLVADCTASPRTITLLARDGTTVTTAIAASPAGWMDSNHLVVQSNTTDSALSVVDVRALSVTPIQVQGFFGGAIPGGL
jgi:hypothetical protein